MPKAKWAMTDTIHIVLAMKPIEGNFSQNALGHEVAGLNIDGCRVGSEVRENAQKGGENLNKLSRQGGNDVEDAISMGAYGIGAKQQTTGYKTVSGRFPANVIHDGSDEVVDGFPDTQGPWGKGKSVSKTASWKQSNTTRDIDNSKFHGESGSAARFFKECKPDD